MSDPGSEATPPYEERDRTPFQNIDPEQTSDTASLSFATDYVRRSQKRRGGIYALIVGGTVGGVACLFCAGIYSIAVINGDRSQENHDFDASGQQMSQSVLSVDPSYSSQLGDFQTIGGFEFRLPSGFAPVPETALKRRSETIWQAKWKSKDVHSSDLATIQIRLDDIGDDARNLEGAAIGYCEGVQSVLGPIEIGEVEFRDWTGIRAAQCRFERAKSEIYIDVRGFAIVGNSDGKYLTFTGNAFGDSSERVLELLWISAMTVRPKRQGGMSN